MKPPQPDEFELSIFGPGRGECVLIHLGWGEWLCVDSCLDRRSRRPIALKYLEDLAVDPSRALKLILITHWHQDHMKGAAEVVRSASNALFACSGALDRAEFFEAVAASEEERHQQSLGEFAEVFQVLTERSASAVWALDGLILWQRSSSPGLSQGVARAISPSHAARWRGMQELAPFLPFSKQPKKRAVSLGPNIRSVALWIEVGQVMVLLGADLENTSSRDVGWKAVLSSSVLPSGKASTVKVPHHGSRDADNTAVWETKIDRGPIAVLAPFSSASRPLPSADDRQRLLRRTPELYCTANPAGSKVPSTDKVVKRKLRSTPRRIRRVSGEVGHICVRRNIVSGSLHSVDLFNGAYKVA